MVPDRRQRRFRRGHGGVPGGPPGALPGGLTLERLAVDVEDAFALTILEALPPPGNGDAPPLGPDAGAAELARAARARCTADARLRRLWALRGWFTGTRPGPWLLLAALLLGLAGTGLGTGGRLDVLAPPLLGFLAWQLLALVLLAPGALRGRPEPHLPVTLTAATRRLPGVLAGIEDAEAGALLRLWLDRAGATLAARWTATFHLAAAALAAGAIAGLYLDGLATAYRAGWESTFLDAGQVAVLVGIVLGPASAATGIPLPGAAGFATMAETGVPAAPWIHLWAATLFGAAVLPRLALAAIVLLRVRGPLDLGADPRLRQQLAALRGRSLAVTVQPVGYRPAARSSERLAEALAARFGARVLTDRREPLRWDAEPAPPEGAGEEIVVVVSAAQTPEEEVHGPLLDGLAGTGRLLLAVDTEAYAADAARRASRAAAWERLGRAHGAEVIALESA